MARHRLISPVLLAVLLAIGCGGRPQNASATTDASPSSQHPLALAQAPAGSAPTPETGSASLTGTVKFDGSAPAREVVKMGADPVCQQQHSQPMHAEDVVVNSNGTLKNVFVYVKKGLSGVFPAPTTPVTLDQAGCWYAPHVAGIQVDQPLEIVNSDATLHNINAKPTVNQPFNIAQPTKGMKATKKFAKPEIMVKFKCNVHPWMNAYLGVVEHPFFAVSGEDGSFTISGLPAGTYTLEAWQEKYGTQEQVVTVAEGEKKSVTFTFKAQ